MALSKFKLFNVVTCLSMKSRTIFIKILSLSSKICRPISTQSINNNFLPQINKNLINDFISIFTNPRFCINNPQLVGLAPLLSTKVVEAVLKGFRSWKIAHMFFDWASNQYGFKHNMYTYNAMASILSNARRNAPLRDLAVSVVESRCFMSPGALGFFIRCLGDVGLVEEANMLFDDVKRMGLCVPNSYCYNCLLEAICKSGFTDLAETRLKEMRGYSFEFTKYTLTPVLQMYCNARLFDKALDVFKQIERQGWLDEYVFSILILSVCKSNEVDKAFELIEIMYNQGIHFNQKTFSTLMNMLLRNFRTDKAITLFEIARKSGASTTPDVSVCYALINELCKNKEIEKAFQLCLQMKESGIHLDLESTGKLISYFSEEGEVIEMLKEKWKRINMEARTLYCNCLLNILVRKGSVDKAYSLLQVMVGNESDNGIELHRVFTGKEVGLPDPTCCIMVVEGLLKAGKLDLALRLFQDMRRIGYKSNLRLYNNVIDKLCSSNRLEESYELLGEMKELGFEPTQFTHNSIFGCLCKKSDVRGAISILGEMRTCGHEPWIKHSTLLVKNLCNSRQVTDACKFLESMVQEGFLPDIIAYSAAMDGFVRIHQVDKAIELFQELCTRGHCPDVVAHNILINGLCKSQRVEEAQNIFNDMLMKGVVPSVVTYNMLIDGWCKTGGIDKAMRWFSQMLESERKPNVITYTTMINGLCSVKRPDEALVLWNRMEVEGKCAANAVAYMALVHGLCRCGRPDEAVVHFYQMKEQEMKIDSFIYVALISAFIANSNFVRAFEMLQVMLNERSFPDGADCNYRILEEAISKLLGDSSTSLYVKNLIDEKKLPGSGGAPTV